MDLYVKRGRNDENVISTTLLRQWMVFDENMTYNNIVIIEHFYGLKFKSILLLIITVIVL